MKKKIPAQALHYLWFRCLASRKKKKARANNGDIKNSHPAYHFIDITNVVLYSLLFLTNKQEETETSMLVAWAAQLLFLPRQSNSCCDVPRLWNIPCSYMKNFLTCVRSWAGAFQNCWAHNQSSGLPSGTTGMWKQTRILSWCSHIKVSKESQNNHNKLFHHLWLADSYMFPQLLVPLKF